MQVPIITLFPVKNVQCSKRRRYADVLETDFISELKSSLFVSLEQVLNYDNVELVEYPHSPHSPHRPYTPHTPYTTHNPYTPYRPYRPYIDHI